MPLYFRSYFYAFFFGAFHFLLLSSLSLILEICDKFILDLGTTTEFGPILPMAAELLLSPVLMIHLVRSATSVKDSVSAKSTNGGIRKGYVALERAALDAAWEEMPSGSLDAPTYPEIASHVREGTIILFDAVRSSFTRCQTLTGGLFMPALINATEELALNFAFKFSSLILVIRKRAGLDTLQAAPKIDGSVKSTWCNVEGSFQLLVASRRLQQTIYDLDREVHTWVKQVIVRWQKRDRETPVHHQHYQQQRNSYGSSSSSSTSSTPSSCSPSKEASTSGDIDYLLQGKQRVWENLIQSDPEANEEMKKQLQRLHSSRTAAAHETERISDNRGETRSVQKATVQGPWESVREQVDNCVQKVQKLVFDCLFLPLRKDLQGLHSWPLWKQQQEKQNDEDVPLPEFSLQPSAYITQVGDTLLTLMEQLEPQVSKYEEQASELKKAIVKTREDDRSRTRAKEVKMGDKLSLLGADGALKQDSSSQFWMSKIVEGLGELLLKEIMDIPRIEDKGSAQLGTDLNYLSNVIQALGVQLNPALEHISKFLVLSTAEIRTRWEQKKLAAGWSKPTLPYLKKLLVTRGIKKAKKRGEAGQKARDGSRAPGEVIATGQRKQKERGALYSHIPTMRWSVWLYKVLVHIVCCLGLTTSM